MSRSAVKTSAIAFAVGALFSSSAARAAYQEAHQTGDDVRVTVDAAGKAQIEHTIRYRVVSGALQKFDLRGIDPGAVIDPAVTVTADDGRELSAHAAAEGERALRVTVDGASTEPPRNQRPGELRGLKRGFYTFRLHYEVDLVATRALVRDGAMWRFSWGSPIAAEGYDGARVLLSFPASQTEPRALKTGPAGADSARDGEGGEDGVLATLHRAPDRDELELVRPHVARGEAVAWAARIDPKAFPGVKTPELRPAPAPAPPEPNRLREVAAGAALLALALAFGAMVRAKARALDEGCARASVFRSATAAAILPMGLTLRALLGGASLAGGVALQALGRPTLGAMLVALAMVTAVSRVICGTARPRGPGRWLALRPAEALDVAVDARRGDRLDIGTHAGKCSATLLGLFAVGVALAARRVSPEAPFLVLLDALALVPIFVTGCAAHLPPDPSRAPVTTLRRLFRRLQKDAALKVAPWARIPTGSGGADELRLLVLPRASMPGLVGVEIGLAWANTASGYLGSPEVLVRVQDGTAAAAKMAALAPFARAIPGRKPEERVIRLAPGLPGAQATTSLVVRVAHALADRRTSVPIACPPARLPAWKGAERRLPPNARVKAEAPRAA